MKDLDFYKEVTKDMVVDLEDIKLNKEFGRKMVNRKVYKFNKVAAAIVICALSIGTVGVSAYAIHHWSLGLKNRFQVSSEQIGKLEETGVVQFPDEDGDSKSVTIDGVTVSVAQTIVDNYFAYIILKVEGYDAKDGTPGFSDLDYKLDGVDVGGCSQFYDDFIDDGTGKAIMSDGSEIPRDEDGSLTYNFMLEDGTMEYHILLYPDFGGEDIVKGGFFGKNLHVGLTDLGLYDEVEQVQADVKGTWSFDWKITGDSKSKIVKMDSALEDTGLVVKECEISPISLRAVIECPDNSDEYMGDKYPLTGVKLKDGTILAGITNGGLGNDPGDNMNEVLLSLTRIIDIDEVESLLFIKSDLKKNTTLDNFYEVAIQ